MSDTPQNEIEIRRWYKKQLEQIPVLNEQWTEQGLPLPERAEKSYAIRREARLKAREMMADKMIVQRLRERDVKRYGNPDGPTFGYLVKRLAERGLEENAIYDEIILSSSRTDAGIDKLLDI